MSKRVSYYCQVCDLNCQDKTKYETHIRTNKHMNRLQDELARAAKYNCICGKKYSHRQGLFVHKKVCQGVKPETTSETTPKTTSEITPDLTRMIIELIKSNTLLVESQRETQELQKQFLTIYQNVPPTTNNTNNTTINNNNTNSHNKSFNLNFFLNEQCKNAINLSKFIDDLEVTRDDLINTGQLGFVEGISKIIMDHLKREPMVPPSPLLF